MRTPRIETQAQILAQMRRDIKRLQTPRGAKPSAPVCRVVLTANKATGAAYSFASTNWSVTEGDASLFTMGSDGVASFLTIPEGWSGRYVISYRCSIVANIAGVAGITKNTADPANTVIARDDGANVNAGSGTLNLNAWDEVVLAEGDRLYWMNWTSAAGTLQATNSGMETRMYIRYIKAN